MTLIGPEHVGGRARRARRGGHGRGSRDRRGARRVRVHAPARPPRHPQRLRRLVLPEQLRGGRGAPARGRPAPVAVIDIDAHHGNGTQAIFWDDDDVLTASVHVDPGAGWFPHFLGFEDEQRGAATQPQPAVWRRARATSPGSRLCASSRTGRGERGAEALVVRARRGRRGGRPREPARGHPRRLPRGGPSARRRWACRPWSCRRAATTWTR